MGLVGKIVGGVIIAAVCSGIVYETLRWTDKKVTQREVVKALDTNKDGKLSSWEIKRFYDEILLSPYNFEALKKVPIKEQKKFLSNYELVYKKR